MPLISIREREEARIGEHFAVTLGIEGVGEYRDVTIHNPLSQEEEKRLEWYFEERIDHPFTGQVIAEETAASIFRYGENLFTQLFADHEAYASYKGCLNVGIDALQFEIIGSPEFHQLHWEALKDPKLPRPFVVEAAMVRKHVQPRPLQASMQPSPIINLLLITARPYGKRDVSYRTITRPLVDALNRANLRVQVEIVRPGTYKALDQRLRAHPAGYYHVIHFDVHGSLLTYEELQKILQQGSEVSPHLFQSRYGRKGLATYQGYKAFLALEGESEGVADLVAAEELAELLLSHQVPIAILNACQSGKQVGASETSLGSRLMAAGVQLVVAMGYSVSVSAAEIMMRTLYEQLFAQQDLASAIRQARGELHNQKERRARFNQTIELEDWLLPVVYQHQSLRLRTREFTPEEHAGYYQRRATSYHAPEPRYGFVGRDLDILHLEKRLLTRRNIVLVQGMGGAGKTMLLHHLGAWWQRTGLIERVFYFGYDERAWTREQILHEIAQSMLGESAYRRDFLPLLLDGQQALLIEKLRAERHLLILDNLESITGAHLAIQHTLPPEEQGYLHRLLASLVGGHTLVLLGSRSGEPHLAPGTFEDNRYDLPGLDPEAAATLADRILHRYNVIQYRSNDDLQRLLKVLDGFPLALEVILANLSRQTPKDILQAMQAGDISLDPKQDNRDKTQSILRCIDYSHSNLSSETQQLLLCLAPFTSAVFEQLLLKGYLPFLQEQPALAHLPFERWQEVLQEAQNWGLLSRDPDNPVFLHLQPIFPYFLRNRLSAPEQAEAQQAVEVAFRKYYNSVGAMISSFLSGNDAESRRIGLLCASREYENLVHALTLDLTAQASDLQTYSSLSNYLLTVRDYHRGLEISNLVLTHLETYPADKLTGSLGVWRVQALINKSNMQSDLNRYQDAEASLQQGLQVAPLLQEVEKKERDRLVSTIYYELAGVARAYKEWDKAEQYLKQALPLKSDDLDFQSKAYQVLGIVAQGQHKWNHAKRYLQKALALCERTHNRYFQAVIYQELGTTAYLQQQWNRAEQYYKAALKIKMEFEDRPSQAITYHCLGNVAQAQQQWTEAHWYYQKALEISIEFNDQLRQAVIYQDLAILASQQNQQHQHDDYDHKVMNLGRALGGPVFYDLNPLASIIDQAVKFWTLGDTDITSDIQAQYEVQKDGEKVFLFSDTPGPLVSVGMPLGLHAIGSEEHPTGTLRQPKHRFLSARELKSSPEVNHILEQSKSVEDFIRLLREKGYQVSRISKNG